MSNHKEIQARILSLVNNNINDPKFLCLNDDAKIREVFTNFRIVMGEPTGIRLTRTGHEFLSKHKIIESYYFEIDDGVTMGDLISLDKKMRGAYYIGAPVYKAIAFYDKQDAAIFKLSGSTVKGFIGML